MFGVRGRIWAPGFRVEGPTWAPGTLNPMLQPGFENIRTTGTRRAPPECAFAVHSLCGIHKKAKKVDVSLPGKGNSNSHGARPVQQMISMMN